MSSLSANKAILVGLFGLVAASSVMANFPWNNGGFPGGGFPIGGFPGGGFPSGGFPSGGFPGGGYPGEGFQNGGGFPHSGFNNFPGHNMNNAPSAQDELAEADLKTLLGDDFESSSSESRSDRGSGSEEEEDGLNMRTDNRNGNVNRVNLRNPHHPTTTENPIVTACCCKPVTAGALSVCQPCNCGDSDCDPNNSAINGVSFLSLFFGQCQLGKVCVCGRSLVNTGVCLSACV